MRSRAVVLTIVSGVLFACTPPPAENTAADEQVIRDMATQYATAWTKADTAGVAALMADKAELIDEASGHVKGKAAIMAMTAKQFAERQGPMTLSLTTTFVLWLAPGGAVAMGDWTMTGGPPNMPPTGTWMESFSKVNGKWLAMGGISNVKQPAPAAPAADTSKTPPKK